MKDEYGFMVSNSPGESHRHMLVIAAVAGP